MALSIENRLGEEMRRREFIRNCAAGVSTLAFGGVLPRLPSGAGVPDMAVVKGLDIGKMVGLAVAALGGIEHFIKKGESVLVKPNGAWERTPEQGANTHPEVVGAIVRLCKGAGASRVVVADRTCHNAEGAFDKNGIKKAALAAGAEVIYDDLKFSTRDWGGKVMHQWGLLDLYAKSDKVINVPVVKNHGLSKMTCSMKNWFGVISGKRALLHQDIHEVIADMAQSCVPSLTVVDATRILLDNGPTGGKMEDVKTLNLVGAGYDQVALDVWAAGLLGYKWEEVGYLLKAKERGIGETDLSKLRLENLDVS